MGENKFPCGNTCSSQSRETVGIETNKILDSCRDRDCYENVKVFLTDSGREIIEHTSTVRTKSVIISAARITVDSVQFNRGFYTVTIRFYIRLVFEACTCDGKSQEFEGMAVIEKKVILYGGESNVSVFKSNVNINEFCSCPEPAEFSKNVPQVIVEAVDPIVLNTRVMQHEEECKCCCCCRTEDVPATVMCCESGNDTFNDCDKERFLAVSLGIFSVIRVIRPAQYLVTASEYSVPDKECIGGHENNPCGIFKNMAFPVEEFGQSQLTPGNIEKRCGC